MLIETPAEFHSALPRDARLLALDVGETTIGLAMSDGMRTIASPLLTIERKKFTKDMEQLKEVIAKHPNMHVIAEDTAKWMREDGMNLMNNWILAGDKIDILSANADEMAIGAAMAIKSNGIKIGKDILVGGTDGGPNGLQAIKTGLLTVTVFQDAKSQAYGAVDMAEKAAKGEKVQDINFIPFQLVTPENYQKFMAN